MMPSIFLDSTVCLSVLLPNWRFCAWSSQLGMLWCWSKQGNCLHGMRHAVLLASLTAAAESVSVLYPAHCVLCSNCFSCLRSRICKADFQIRAIAVCALLLTTAQSCFTSDVWTRWLVFWQMCVAHSVTVAQAHSDVSVTHV